MNVPELVVARNMILSGKTCEAENVISKYLWTCKDLKIDANESKVTCNICGEDKTITFYTGNELCCYWILGSIDYNYMKSLDKTICVPKIEDVAEEMDKLGFAEVTYNLWQLGNISVNLVEMSMNMNNHVDMRVYYNNACHCVLTIVDNKAELLEDLINYLKRKDKIESVLV